MSKNNENKLVPRIRFPEYLNDVEWKKDKLEKLTNITIGEFVIKTKQNPNSPYPVYNGGRSFTGFYDEYNNEANKIVISARGAYAGYVNLLKQRYWAGNSCYSVSIINEKLIDLDFLFYYIKENQRRFTDNQQAANIPSVSKADVQKFIANYPENIKEQQKIAACLSSLDEVITAEQEKLEQLKQHKKGLLQNLFPQEGETTPKLRFQEFKDSGEWEEKRLGEVGEPLMCKRIFKEETTTSPNNGVPFYKIGTFGHLADSYITKEIYEEYKNKYSFPKVGDILISASGTIGRLVVYDGSPAYFQDSNIIWLGHNEEMVLNKFLFYCYSILRWQTSDGGVISRLYNSDFKRMKISFPKNQKEQQKIAACLSSLDELIDAQSKKIELLQQHKKGLMQGLFPDLKNYENG